MGRPGEAFQRGGGTAWSWRFPADHLGGVMSALPRALMSAEATANSSSSASKATTYSGSLRHARKDPRRGYVFRLSYLLRPSQGRGPLLILRFPSCRGPETRQRDLCLSEKWTFAFQSSELMLGSNFS